MPLDDFGPDPERHRRPTNLEKITDYMEHGSPLRQAFVMEAMGRYAKEVLMGQHAVREAMKDTFINGDLWVQCAEDWKRANP